MPTRKKKNITWENGPTSGSAQSRIRFSNSCAKHINSTLPRKRFTVIKSLYYELTDKSYDNVKFYSSDGSVSTIPSSTKVKPQSKNRSITINKHFHDEFIVHPNISVNCAFCNNIIPPRSEIPYIFIQPHSRGRYTPMCMGCKNL